MMLFRLPQPVFMADLARALQTPVPATQPAPQQPQPTEPVPMGRGERAAVTRADNAARDAKNKRDQERRKAQRAAHAKAVEAALAKKKKRKAKKKVAAAPAPVRKKARGRGRPPGSKNKPKPGLSVALVPAPGVLPRAVPIETGAFGALNVAMNALYALPVAKRVDVLTMLNRLFG